MSHKKINPQQKIKILPIENNEKINELIKKIKEQEKTIQVYTETLKRLQAEFENYIKRANKEKETLLQIGKHELIVKLLPIIDTFEKALHSIEADQEKDKVIDGIKMIFAQFFKLLQEHGLKPIEAVGKKHDPYLHEVIKKIDNQEEEGIILEEIQKGYTINNLVLRHSKVIISNGKKQIAVENINREEKNEQK